MSDVASGSGAAGDEPDPYVPSGARRSSFTPPPADADPPAFDDDALADALAAQVASYTSPIPVVGAVVGAVEGTPAQSVAPEPDREPEPEPPTFPAEPEPEPQPEPAPEPEPAETDAPEPSPADGGGSATLEAIERLESELRRRAELAATGPGAVIPPVSPPAAPPPDPQSPVPPSAEAPPTDRLFPAPPTFLRSEPPEASDIPVWAPPPASEPIVLPEPPTVAPPPLVEPPAPTTGQFPVFVPHTQTPGFGTPPVTPPVDLPPPLTDVPTGAVGPADYAHLPPPVGLEPAALPPYQPSAEPEEVPPGAPLDLASRPLAPPPADFAALLGATPPPHPDDLGAGDFAPPPAAESEPALDDAVDEVDRVFGTGALAVDATGAVAVVHPPSEPIPTLRVTEGEESLLDPEPKHHPALAVEAAGSEPTPLDLRAGRAARMFWLWFATNSSVISLSLGAVLFGLGMNLRQSIVAIVIGVALSFLPLGLVTLAGKWSGQPTMVVSRATFGRVGNVLPTLIAVVSRVFWGAALLWLLASGVARVLVDAGLDAGLGEVVWTYVGLGAGFALAFVVAIFGYGLIARVQLVLSILTGILVVGVIVLTAPRVDLDVALRADDGPWALLIAGIVLVFSFVGLAWVHSTGDVARYQRTDGDGGSTMLWATFGATLPALLLIGWGALLAASDPVIADGLATNPLHTIAALLPIWYPAPLIAAIGLGLLSGAVLTIYSGGFALQALGIRARRSVTTAIAGILVLAVAAALVVLVGEARDLIRDVATTVAVPVAAWVGIFGAEMMLRRRGFDSEALLRPGGVYPAVRWVNLLGLVAFTAIGFGLTSAALPGLGWQGYLFPVLGVAGGDPLVASDLGVLVALGLGILLPLVTAVPTIRRQEHALGDDPDLSAP